MEVNVREVVHQVNIKRHKLKEDIEKLLSEFERDTSIDIELVSIATKNVSPRVKIALTDPFKTT